MSTSSKSSIVGYRFHPTNEELINHYLKNKRLDPNFSVKKIKEINIYDYEPFELPGLSPVRVEDGEWHFFCAPDYKYRNSKRVNRRIKPDTGNWKVTGRKRDIKDKNKKKIGEKNTLVFYLGHGNAKKDKTNWVMHEFRITDQSAFKKDYVLVRVRKNPTVKNQPLLSHHEDILLTPDMASNSGNYDSDEDALQDDGKIQHDKSSRRISQLLPKYDSGHESDQFVTVPRTENFEENRQNVEEIQPLSQPLSQQVSGRVLEWNSQLLPKKFYSCNREDQQVSNQVLGWYTQLPPNDMDNVRPMTSAPNGFGQEGPMILAPNGFGHEGPMILASNGIGHEGPMTGFDHQEPMSRTLNGFGHGGPITYASNGFGHQGPMSLAPIGFGHEGPITSALNGFSHEGTITSAPTGFCQEGTIMFAPNGFHHEGSMAFTPNDIDHEGSTTFTPHEGSTTFSQNDTDHEGQMTFQNEVCSQEYVPAHSQIEQVHNMRGSPLASVSCQETGNSPFVGSSSFSAGDSVYFEEDIAALLNGFSYESFLPSEDYLLPEQTGGIV